MSTARPLRGDLHGIALGADGGIDADRPEGELVMGTHTSLTGPRHPTSTSPGPDLPLPEGSMQQLRQFRKEFTRLMLSYQFGMDEISAKARILREEFAHLHDDNPIEHICTRLKNPDSVIDKITRKGLSPTLENIRTITDIAGVRITCSFTSDTYRVFDALTRQPDITVRQVKDYIRRRRAGRLGRTRSGLALLGRPTPPDRVAGAGCRPGFPAVCHRVYVARADLPGCLRPDHRARSV